jgi:Tfp pilus assembly protein PilF
MKKIFDTHSTEALQEILLQARYHLGQVLYLGELDLNRAVSELERVVRQDPENTPALYHLGQAIREQERKQIKRAEEVLRRYLQNGAPIGHEDEVREFLGSRRESNTFD